jgi:hypothetical protein
MRNTIALVAAAICLNAALRDGPLQATMIRLDDASFYSRGASAPNPHATVGAIPAPEGFRRVELSGGSFGAWLRAMRLKADRTVYLYNGQPKTNQSAQFAVVDIPVGTRDLQQCADAVMRMRAEYLLASGRPSEIVFHDNEGKSYRWTTGGDRAAFERYMQKVFAWCGTLSLEKEMKPVNDVLKISPGDVFIKGGSPGHAVIVVDMAVDRRGRRAFLLAQSYMPAQDIHILKNPKGSLQQPWYTLDQGNDLSTPEWTFQCRNLKTW